MESFKDCWKPKIHGVVMWVGVIVLQRRTAASFVIYVSPGRAYMQGIVRLEGDSEYKGVKFSHLWGMATADIPLGALWRLA